MLKKTNKLDKSMLELLFEVPAETWITRETEAIEFLGQDLEIDGFRKGKAPLEVLKKHLPEIMILEKSQRSSRQIFIQKLLLKKKFRSLVALK